MKNKLLLVLVFLVGSTTFSLAQSYIIDNEPSSLSVLGTSTLHDWKISADTIIGAAKLKLTERKLKDITSLTISIPITSMHSGLGPLDKHMRVAMTANGANTVDFKLVEVSKITPNSIGGYTIQATGELTIIKTVKKTRMQATLELNKDGSIRFFGETMIDMTDYSVEPPQAEMGTIKTEKDVKIVFDVIMNKK